MTLRLFLPLLLVTAPAIAQTLPYDVSDAKPVSGPTEAAPAPEAAAKPGDAFRRDETKAEAEARGAAMFERMDLDHDGFVTQAEATDFFTALLKSRGGSTATVAESVKSMIDDADTNHDGKISVSEAKAAADRGFDEADTNHDGIVSPAERAAAMREVAGDKPTAKAKPAEAGR